MLVFNQKILTEINTKTSKGEAVVVKVKAETAKAINGIKKKTSRNVDSVTTGTMATKMHFAQSHIAAQKTNKINKE